MLGLKKENYEKFNDNFETHLNPDTLDTLKARYDVTADELKRAYIGNDQISYNNHESFIDLYGDIYFVEPLHRTIETQARKGQSATYAYLFSYDKGLSFSRLISGSTLSGAQDLFS